jgi:ABC-type multidrug transport system fused ATPase/permease subunit
MLDCGHTAERQSDAVTENGRPSTCAGAKRAGARHAGADRAVLVIAHRLGTVQLADEIVVLDRGRVAERGNNAALVKKRGLYY